MYIVPYINLFLGFSIPIYCLWNSRHKVLIAWLSLNCATDLFNFRVMGNITSLKMAGMVLLPWLILRWNNKRLGVADKTILLIIVHLAILTICYGQLFRWPDTLDIRGPKDLAPYRSLMAFGGHLLHFCVALGMAKLIESRADYFLSARWFIYAATINSLGAFAEYLFEYDFYSTITGGVNLLLPNRLRGFAYEPRGLGYYSLIGLFLAITLSHGIKRSHIFVIGIIISFWGIAQTASSSVLILFAIFVIISTVYMVFRYIYSREFDAKEIAFLLCTIITVSVGFKSSTHLYGKEATNETSRRLQERMPWNNISKGPLRALEAADATAVNFFVHHPYHLAVGVGPGMIHLAATPYLLDNLHEYEGSNIIKYRIQPHSGVFRILADGGIVFLSLVLFLFGLAYKRIVFEGRRLSDFDIRLGATITLGLIFFLCQFQSPVIFIFGLTLAACEKTHKKCFTCSMGCC